MVKNGRRLDKCTIYLLTNEANGKVYIGQSWYPLNIRMGRNGENYKNSVYLYSAIKKYGADKFRYDMLDVCDDQETADHLENLYIEKYDSRTHNIGYNIKTGGSVGLHSEETKAKISATLKAQVALWTPEELAKRTAIISTYWEGKERGPHTEEWKEENSIRTKEWHANNEHPMAGKTHSEDTVNKIGEASKEAWSSGAHTPESIKKGAMARMMDSEREKNIIQAYKGGKAIADIEKAFQTGRSSIYRILKRNNISQDSTRNSWAGKEHSEETKQKMAEARKSYWDTKKSSDPASREEKW